MQVWEQGSEILPFILTFTTLWANTAEDKLMPCFYFSKETGFEISYKLSPNSIGDNVHEMSYYVSWEKQEKYFNMLSAIIFTQLAKH